MAKRKYAVASSGDEKSENLQGTSPQKRLKLEENGSATWTVEDVNDFLLRNGIESEIALKFVGEGKDSIPFNMIKTCFY